MNRILTPCRKFFVFLLLSSAFFLLLYRYNNKYTYPGAQAAAGLLVLSEEELQAHPLRFLCYGWEFYPDVLLTPSDLETDADSRYMFYTYAGEHSRLDVLESRDNPHGCGTYVLHLILPAKLRTYALELPEIFSAYKLYVDGRLMLQMGDPDPKQYKPLIQKRMVTFDKSEEVTIMLAVSDYSHFYSGMVYPPAFGTPLALNMTRALHLGLCLSANTIALVVALLSFYLGLSTRQKNPLLYGLLCLAMCGFTSYPLIHSMAALPVFPWYGLELACGYLTTFLVVILHNRLCKDSSPIAHFSTGLTAFAFVLSLIYGLGASLITSASMHLFSLFISCFKAFIALFLLIRSYLFLRQKEQKALPLFYGSAFYAMSFLWDRLLPSYEPIYGGWFLELGCIFMILTAGYTLWKDLVNVYAYNTALAEEHRQVTRQLAMQTEYSRQLNEWASENRRLIHDFRQHLRILYSLAEENGQSQILDYLQQVTNGLAAARSIPHITFCSNAAVDALLRYYYGIAQEKQIKIDIRISIPSHFSLTDVEFCTVLGNLLENAIEACERQTAGTRFILLKSREDGGTWYLLLENSYDGKLKHQGAYLLSRKEGPLRIGIGVQSAKKILKQHQGSLDLFEQPHTFKAGISIPLEDSE